MRRSGGVRRVRYSSERETRKAFTILAHAILAHAILAQLLAGVQRRARV
jgi:hypothetical protein